VKRKILKFLIFASPIVFLIISRQNSFNIPFERDEGEYAYSAWLMRMGASPYKYSFLQKPPMIIYTYFLAQLINPDSFWPPRVLALLSLIISVILLGKIAKKEFGEKAGIIAMWIFVSLTSLPQFTPYAANTEVFMLSPLIAILYLYTFNRKNTKNSAWFFSGLLAAISVLYKPISLPVIVFVFSAWTLERLKNNTKLLPQNILSVLFGLITALVLVFAYFFEKRALGNMFESAVWFNSYYLKNLKGTLFPFFAKPLLLTRPILLLTFIAYLLKPSKRLVFHSALLLVTSLTLYSAPFGHYYILLIPFLSLAASGGIYHALNHFHLSKSIPISLLIVFFIILPTKNIFFLNKDELYSSFYASTEPFKEAPRIAQELVKITKPNDYVFIAGSEPEILYYAGRKSSSRFVITYPLNIKSPKQLDYQNEVIKDIEKNTPQAIILSQFPSSKFWVKGNPTVLFDYTMDLLNNKYILVGSFIRDGGSGYWENHPSNENLSKSSFLIYKRISI